MRNVAPLVYAIMLSCCCASQIATPLLDLSSIGRVAVVGQFSGISLYQDTTQTEILSSRSTSGLFQQSSDGFFTNIAESNGVIHTICALNYSNTEIFYIGGNFSEIGNVAAVNVASYNLATNEFSSLSTGVLGTVNALYCDSPNNEVYIGGTFEISNSTNVVIWNASQQRFSTIAFGGFDGTVNTIDPSGSSILFGGKFDSVAEGNSSSVDEPQQVNLQTAYVTSENSATTTGLSNPNNIVCPSGQSGPGSTWLLADNEAGSWSAAANFTFRPSMFRMYNTFYEGRGTKEFRFVAEPINGILNLTYTDPTTGQQSYCDARCPLSSTTNSTYQEFKFVNVIEMNAFSLEISEWYGLGAGLDGFELFTEDINAFAIAGFNEPSCASGTYLSTSSVVGAWTPIIIGSEPGYLAANLSGAYLSTDSVTFEPQISQRGSYSVRMYTPGCLTDGTCASRGGVTVSVYAEADVAPTNVTLYQTNNYDKYDTIYQGSVSASSDSFRPKVLLGALSGQSGTINTVASRVQFLELDSSGSANLNGLYQYDPATYSSSSISNTSFDNVGSTLGFDASISAVTVVGATTYIAGNFTGSGVANIVALQGSTVSSPLSSGLNGAVSSTILINEVLYIGGTFTALINSTISASYIVAYNTTSNAWLPLGAGLNGPVTNLFAYNGTLGVSGAFTAVNAYNTHAALPVSATAFWDKTSLQWSTGLGYIDGTIVKAITYGSYTYYIGNIRSTYQVAGPGVAALLSSGSGQRLSAIVLPIDSTSTVPSAFDVNTGSFYNSSTQSLTILGGRFSTLDSANNTINNVAILSSNGSVTGLPVESLSNASTVFTSHVDGQRLFLGGSLSGTIGTSDIDGLVIYDLDKSALDPVQPAALQGADVQVNTITTRPGVAQIVVGGNFDAAGSLTCPSLCVLDSASTTWQRPAIGLAGNVSSSTWLGQNTLLLAGNMTLNGTTQYLVTFDFSTQAFSSVTRDLLPGPALVAVSDTNSTSSVYVAGQTVNGTAYLAKWNGNSTTDLSSGLSMGTEIYALQFVPLSKRSAASNDIMNSNRNLLVLGNLNLTGNGTVSGALFDGADYAPYLLSNTVTGTPGSIRTIFSEQQISFSSGGSGLSRGAIIGIALAISFFITSSIVLCGLLAAYVRRRRDGYRPANQTIPEKTEATQQAYADENFQSLKGTRK